MSTCAKPATTSLPTLLLYRISTFSNIIVDFFHPYDTMINIKDGGDIFNGIYATTDFYILYFEPTIIVSRINLN